MHIGLLAPPWVEVPPAQYGGTELVIANLAAGLGAAGHRVTVFTVGSSRCEGSSRRWVYPEAQTDAMGDVLTEVRQVVAGYDALAGCDLVHDHTLAGPLMARRLADVPVVATAHGSPAHSAPLADVYAAIGRAVPLIAISDAQRHEVADIGFAATIHHGIDVGVRVGPGDGGYVAFLGRMAPEKGVREAILAAKAAGVPIRIGAKCREPLQQRYFAEHVRPLLGPDAVFVGELPRDAIGEFLGRARALLNPIAWNEPFGLVMVEALAVGTPVVATAMGAAPEIVDHGLTGFLCHDRSELVSALGAVERLDREACRAAAAERFSLARMAAAHVDLYREVLGTAPTRTDRRPRPGAGWRGRLGA